MTEASTNETTASELIAAVPPFAERLRSDSVPIQIRALTFAEARFMRAKVAEIPGETVADEMAREDVSTRWLLKFGVVGAEALGLHLKRESFETAIGKTDALTDISLAEFQQQPNGIVMSAVTAILQATFPTQRELDRLDFTLPSADHSGAAGKIELVPTATTNGKLN